MSEKQSFTDKKLIKERALILEKTVKSKNIISVIDVIYNLNIQNLFNDTFSMNLPIEFSEINEGSAKRKYPSEFRPNLVFTNDNENTDFTFSILESNNSIIDLHSCIEGCRSVHKRAFPTSVLSKIHKTYNDYNLEICYFTYEKTTLNGKIFGLQYNAIIKENLLLGGFSSPLYHKKYWEIPVVEILKNIQIL